MKTFRLIGMALITMLMCVTSCSKDDDEPTKPEETPTITIDSSIITNGLAFTSENGEKSVTFTTNTDWTLDVAATKGGSTWCVPSTTSGTKGDITVKFTTTANDDYSDRSVAVTIKAGTASNTFTITQKQKDAILLTTDKFELDQKGGTINVEVKANTTYQIAISESAEGWITEVPTRSLATHNHSFKIAENYDGKREGEIYFRSGEQVATVKVYQTGSSISISELVGIWEITHSKGHELKDDGTKEEWDNEMSGEFFQFDKDNTGSSFRYEDYKSPFTWSYKDLKLSITNPDQELNSPYRVVDYKITTLNDTTLVMESTVVKEDETEFEITTYKRISK